MSPIKCGVSECNRETSTMRGPWPSRGFCTVGGRGNRRRSNNFTDSPIPWPCRCIAVIEGSNPAEGMDVHPLGLCVV